jgi:hypothetical protein
MGHCGAQSISISITSMGDNTGTRPGWLHCVKGPREDFHLNSSMCIVGEGRQANDGENHQLGIQTFSLLTVMELIPKEILVQWFHFVWSLIQIYFLVAIPNTSQHCKH